MNVALVLLCGGLGLGAVIVACAFAYKLVLETRIKRHVFERTAAEQKDEDTAANDLTRRLEAFRRERFGKNLMTDQDTSVGMLSTTNRVRRPTSQK